MNKANATNAAIIQGTACPVAAALGILVAIIARPALAADASNGERLAERWRAACHVVSLDQRQASSDAPPFEEIARGRNFSETGMMTFCSTRTPRCPT
jgi:hypothetical protein